MRPSYFKPDQLFRACTKLGRKKKNQTRQAAITLLEVLPPSSGLCAYTSSQSSRRQLLFPASLHFGRRLPTTTTTTSRDLLYSQQLFKSLSDRQAVCSCSRWQDRRAIADTRAKVTGRLRPRGRALTTLQLLESGGGAGTNDTNYCSSKRPNYTHSCGCHCRC